MKKAKGLIICLICVIIMLITTIIFMCSNNSNGNRVCNNEIKIDKKTYYNNMLEKMHSYFKIYYRFVNIPEEKKDIKLVIRLSQLEAMGFPLDEFVSYKDNKTCDKENTYAVRSLKDNKYVINVFYKCGEDNNYPVK